MKNKLSYSQVNRYGMCPKSYEYHYVQKIRQTTTTGALLFGSALDNALNVLLTEPDKSPEETFERSFQYSKINEVNTYIPTSENVVYANSDFDSDLLLEEDFKFIKEQLTQGRIQGSGDILQHFQTLKDKKASVGFDGLSKEEKRYYNLMNWLCLRRKGFLMLVAYRKKVMPKLTKVHEVQKHVQLENDSGDSVVGYVDLIADVEGHGTVILDNKTSGMKYEEDSVITSPQLSLYLHILEDQYKTRKAGYIVLIKQVIKNKKKVCSKCGHDGSGARHKTCDNMVDGKRCHGDWNETIDPEIFVQFIVDEIPEQTENIVLENMDNVNDAIKHGVFTRNLNSCQNWYGGKCAFFDLCYKNKMSGLCKVNKK